MPDRSASNAPPVSPKQRISHMCAVKSRPKPSTPVNREPLVSRNKGRIYLHCGDAITRNGFLSRKNIEKFAARYDS
jgi:hypothetical protein